jgi:hypothetical protein
VIEYRNEIGENTASIEKIGGIKSMNCIIYCIEKKNRCGAFCKFFDYTYTLYVIQNNEL